MTTSQETKELFSALVKCQAEIEGAVKDSTNPAFKSKYADLSSVIEAAKTPLKNAGLALTIGLTAAESGVSLEALLVHDSGQFVKYDPFTVLVTKKDAQGQGSAITYGRRYLTMSILAIPAEDDDGNAASQPKKPQEHPKQEDPKPTTEKPQPSKKWLETRDALSSLKPQLTDLQIEALGAKLKEAGDKPVLLDNVLAMANNFVAENIEANAQAVAAGFGGTVLP